MKTKKIRQYISHFCKILGITSSREKKKKKVQVTKMAAMRRKTRSTMAR